MPGEPMPFGKAREVFCDGQFLGDAEGIEVVAGYAELIYAPVPSED